MNTRRMLFILFVAMLQVLSACGSPAAPATLEPAPTPEPPRPEEVVQNFWDAMKAENVDVAITFLADDVACRGSCYFSGKASFQALLQGMINSGSTTEIAIVKVDGNTVTYTYKVYRNGFVVEDNAAGESMQVQDGKIFFWNNMHF